MAARRKTVKKLSRRKRYLNKNRRLHQQMLTTRAPALAKYGKMHPGQNMIAFRGRPTNPRRKRKGKGSTARPAKHQQLGQLWKATANPYYGGIGKRGIGKHYMSGQYSPLLRVKSFRNYA
jgi:hypothetical protein